MSKKTLRPRLVKWQRLNVLDNRNTNYGSWLNAQYSSFSVSGDVREDPRANPDVIAAPDEPVASDQLHAILTALDRGGEKLLTKRQRKVFQLILREGKTFQQVANRFKCTPQAIDQCLNRAAVKLRKLALINM